MTRMLPLYTEHQREMLKLMGPDYWPYGVEANRKTLDAFLGYHHDLGISKRRWKPEEIFLPETRVG
jgi:4,5-dihydroxyphthalate decarboxylase